MEETRRRDTQEAFGRGGPRKGWMSVHYVLFFEAMFAAVAFLNVLDLWTSSVALSQGLVEGNAVITKLAGALGLQTIGGLMIMKVAAILGGLAAASVGIRTKDRKVRKLAIGVMLFLAGLLVVVSLNNLYLIGTV
ncbi:MAG TPA: hypothetical protein VEJ19_06400 [Nitrososphaerales archaeon]|nr:hypothetical protein [Nitrososphaerales archaeon]